MESETKLMLVKIIHMLIWVFFNVVIFSMLYAAIVNKIDIRLWIGYGLLCAEGITLLITTAVAIIFLWGTKTLADYKYSFTQTRSSK